MPRKRVQPLIRFAINTVQSGIRIVATNHASVHNDNHLYEGVWECCGRTIITSHKVIQDRIRNERTVCRHCARKLKKAKPNPSYHNAKAKGNQPTKETPSTSTQTPLTWAPTTVGLLNRNKVI